MTNQALAELKLASALNRESKDPTVKRILEDVEAVRAKGAQAVEVNANLRKLRTAGRRLVEAARP